MAEEQAAKDSDKPSAPKVDKKPMLLALVNTLAVLTTLGTLVYTKMLYKRPKITETSEMERMEQQLKAKKTAVVSQGHVTLDKMTINIASTSEQELKEGTLSSQVRPKRVHTAQFAIALELRDMSRKDEVELVKAIFLDNVMTLVSKKSYADLTSVQGRYLIRTQIMDLANDLIFREVIRKKNLSNPEYRENLISNVYFNNLTVQ